MQSTDVRSWLFERALPLWFSKAYESETGRVAEALTFGGEEADLSYLRTRVLFRQVYVASHAGLLGWEPGAAIARTMLEWALRHAWRADGAGFVRKLGRDGSVADATIDLYDNAFALHGLAWLHRVAPSEFTLRWLQATWAAIQTTLDHPSGHGFYNDESRQLPRLQNPHMHLCEALLAAFEATQQRPLLDGANDIARICVTHFFDGQTLGEHFDASWVRLEDIVEPGHMFEWAWILAQHQRLGGSDYSDVIASLIDAAERLGTDPTTGRVRMAVTANGQVIDGSSRTWPSTERLKAAVAAAEVLGHDSRGMAESALAVLFRDHLLSGGGWRDHYDPAGGMTATNMPTSTFYHVFLALAEWLRHSPE